jgi:hypothetical protein
MIALLVILAELPLVGTMEFDLLEDASNGWGVLQWPVVAADPIVADGINRVLDYESITGEPLYETIAFFREEGHGISGSSFTVDYLDREYLCISIFVEFYGAYPSTFKHSFLFDLENGEPVNTDELFLSERKDELVLLCDSILQENIQTEMEENLELYQMDSDDHMYSEHHFAMDDLGSAGMTGEGMVFEYQFGFPHAILAAEPSGVIFLTWDELEGFLQPGVRRN